MLGRNQHVYHVRLLVVNHGLSVLVYCRSHVEPGSGFGLERVLVGDTNNLNVGLLQDERNVNASYVAAADDTYVHPLLDLLLPILRMSGLRFAFQNPLGCGP